MKQDNPTPAGADHTRNLAEIIERAKHELEQMMDHNPQGMLLVNQDGAITVGRPTVPGVKVSLEIAEHLRGKKIVVFKMKRRKRYRRKQGHRQELTRVTVKDIVLA